MRHQSHALVRLPVGPHPVRYLKILNVREDQPEEVVHVPDQLRHQQEERLVPGPLCARGQLHA